MPIVDVCADPAAPANAAKNTSSNAETRLASTAASAPTPAPHLNAHVLLDGAANVANAKHLHALVRLAAMVASACRWAIRIIACVQLV